MIKWNLIEKEEPEKGDYIYYIDDLDRRYYEERVFSYADFDDVFAGTYLGGGYVDDEPDGEPTKVWAWFHAPDFSVIYEE